jgi:ATP-dependent Zn protease
MSEKLGQVSYSKRNVQPGVSAFSEETAKVIDSEVRRIVDEAFTRAKQLLTKHKDSVEKVSFFPAFCAF